MDGSSSNDATRSSNAARGAGFLLANGCSDHQRRNKAG